MIVTVRFGVDNMQQHLDMCAVMSMHFDLRYFISLYVCTFYIYY